MISKYKAVFFDAGGTLFHPFPSVGQIYHEVAFKHGLRAGPHEIESRFRQIWRQRDGMVSLVAHSSEKIEKEWWRDLVREVFAGFGLFKDFDAFFQELYEVFGRPESWRLYPEALDILSRIQVRGQKLAVVSNWDSRLFQLIEGLKVSAYFDFVLASAVFGASKPSPRIFEEALRLSGLGPREAVHIGDSLEDDIRGAACAGMDAILIDRHPEQDREYPDGVAVVHNLRDIL